MTQLIVRKLKFPAELGRWISLYQECFGPDPNRKVKWASWFNLGNPLGPCVNYGLFAGPDLVGAYGFSPAGYTFKGKRGICAIGVNAMMLAKYRGLGRFAAFLEEVTAIESAKRPLFTFPHSGNKASLTCHEKAGWRRDTRLRFFQIPLGSEPYGGWLLNEYSFELAMNNVDWPAISRSTGFSRNLAWLKWRYRDHPFKKYCFFGLNAGAGYAVASGYGRPRGRVLQIVDERSSCSRDDVILVNEVGLAASEYGFKGIEWPIGEETTIARNLEAIGYAKRRERFIMYRAGGENIDEDMGPMLGDSDTP